MIVNNPLVLLSLPQNSHCTNKEEGAQYILDTLLVLSVYYVPRWFGAINADYLITNFDCQ